MSLRQKEFHASQLEGNLLLNLSGLFAVVSWLAYSGG